MEGRPERISDYFVVVGLGKNISQFEQFPLEEVDFQRTTGEPITDIAILFKRSETTPKGYKCIEVTPSGNSANLNSGNPFSGPIHLCYRRGRDRAPLTEISVFYVNQNQRPPPDYEPIAFSVGGKSADLNKSGRTPTFFMVKRGVLYGHSTAITGICLIAPSKGEEPPPGYKLLKMDLNKGIIGHSLFLCYKSSLVLPAAVAYTPELISRYPLKDHPEFPLPESVPLFCLPFGVSVEHWDRHAHFPLPTFSTFALTNAQGQCMYGAVVVFYEPMTERDCTPAMRKALAVGNEEVLHMNKCICLLSHWPFFSAFKSFLSALYRLSLSGKIPLPLERYIGNLMLDVPFPTMERPRVQMGIGSENIIFSLPVQTPLPISVSTHWSLLASLDADNCVTLLSLLLLEQKIVLHSSRPALLTCMGEAMRSILFPFSWQCTYIPMCPLAFSSYMQAPVPFIIGIDSQYFDVFEKPTEVCVVDLDANIITLSKDARNILEQKPMPSKPTRVLKQSLKNLAAKVAGLAPGNDLAVEVAPLEYQGTSKMDVETVDIEIREAFLRFHATIIGHYRMCLRPLLSAPSDHSWDISYLFDQQLFLKHCPTAEWPFFLYLFDTQVFTSFIEQRSFAHAESTALAFFDECTEKLKQVQSAQLLDVVADVSRRSDLPTVVSLPPCDIGLPRNKTYSYPTFPQLDLSLIRPSASLSARDSFTGRRRSILPGSPLVARRTQAEKTKDRALLGKALHNHSLWSKSLLSHVCSLWYVLLPSHLATHWNKMGVLAQALELLEDMRKKQALPSDEVCYRILMEQCVALGRPALAVRVYHEMIKAGIQPNAVTYGFYNKAVMEGKWPSKKRNWKILKIVVYACFYLRRQQKNVFDEVGEADFSSLTLTRTNSRKSISALDVGVDENVEGGLEHSILTPMRRQTATSHQSRGKVYKLSTSMLSSGDYVVRGDSSYMADKSPRWGDITSTEEQKTSLARGFWTGMRVNSPSSPKTRRLSRVTENDEEESPSLNIEITSCTQCPSCKKLLYDEQIMANWSSSDADYKTSCPYCHTKLVASLTIVLKQTLPCSGSSMNKPHSEYVPTSPIPEEDERIVSPPTSPLPRCHTWDTRMAKSKTVDHDQWLPHTRGAKSVAMPTHNQLTNHNENSRENDPFMFDSFDVSKSLPPDLLSTPRTDPLHRKIRSLGAGEAFLTGEGFDEDGTSKLQSTSPNGSHKQEGEVAVKVTRPSTGDSDPPTPHRPSPASTGGSDQPDLAVSSYIAQLRARGHRRTSSAPVHSRPEPAPRGAVENGREKRTSSRGEEKPKFQTESGPPLVVPYLSPVVLRKEVEYLITQDGTKGLQREELVNDSPIIYWNLVWYFSRLQLPTYLPLLTLWGFTRCRQELRKQYVKMKVDLLWDTRVTGVRDPLYLMWLGKVPRVIQIPHPSPQRTKRDSESQLQSLVARTQCGDFLPVLRSLLEDREQQGSNFIPRSIYRETFFLRSVLAEGVIDIDLFEREYQQHLQRLPRDLSPLLHQQDYLPSPRALQCRRDFGCLTVT